MRVTIKELRRIIKEEYAKVLEENYQDDLVGSGNLGDLKTDNFIADIKAALQGENNTALSKENAGAFYGIIEHAFNTSLTNINSNFQLLALEEQPTNQQIVKAYIGALKNLRESGIRINELIKAFGLSK